MSLQSLRDLPSWDVIFLSLVWEKQRKKEEVEEMGHGKKNQRLFLRCNMV